VKAQLQASLGSTAVVYDYAADFDELWRMEFSADTVVVVYTRTPGDERVSPVDTAQFLSPLIWALCAKSTRALRRVAILSQGDRHTATSGLQPYFDLLRSETVPWLRIAQPHDLEFENQATLARSLGVHGDPPDKVAGEDAIAALLNVLRQRLTDSSSPDDRHAISNLVGPFLLLGRQPTSVGGTGRTEADHISALHRVLITCGLLNIDTPTAPVVETTRLSVPAGARLFILDDQWRHGWGEWVCSQIAGAVFGAPPVIEDGWTRLTSAASPITVFASADPASLLGSSVTPGPLRLFPGQRDMRFELTMDGEPDAADILLLDLRLFAGGGTRERALTRDLVELCRKFTGDRDRAWPGFRKSELDEIQAWAGASADHRVDGAVATKARGLLGRLAALTDLSLPIVLFSSTADRDLIEQFKNYGNVITTFHKPRTFGLSAKEDRSYFVDLFRGAMEQALVLLDARGFVRRVRAWARDGHERATDLAAQANGANWSYAELYIDEHGTGGGQIDRAGGYIALYGDSDVAPLALSEVFTKPWGVGREAPNFRGPFRAKASSVDAGKREAEYAKRAEEIRSGASTSGVGLSACVVDGTTSSHEEAAFGPDAIYRALISVAVEFFLYDWLPAIGTALSRTPLAGVFLGTRLQYSRHAQPLIANQWNFGMPLNAFPSQRGNAAEMSNKEQFRLQEHDATVGYVRVKGAGRQLVPSDATTHQIYGRTMESADAFALVLAIARERQASATVKRAVAVTLTYDVKGWVSPPPELPRQVHYASDDLLHKPEAASAILHSGFRCTLSAGLTELLHASRAFDSGATLAVGLQHFRESTSDLGHLGVLPLWVSVRCAPLLSSMKGSDFIEFATSSLHNAAALRAAAQRKQPGPSQHASHKSHRQGGVKPKPKPPQHRPAAQPVRPVHVQEAQAVPTAKAFRDYLKNRTPLGTEVVKSFISTDLCVVVLRSTDGTDSSERLADLGAAITVDLKLDHPPVVMQWTDDWRAVAAVVFGDSAATELVDNKIVVTPRQGVAIERFRLNAAGVLTGRSVEVRGLN
jgi:hypothetical protein